MTASSLERRADRRSRNQQHVDMNLVALIDIFTILIFFLLSSAGGVEWLSAPKAVKLPESVAETAPRQTLVVAVAGDDILLDGRRVASVQEALALQGDLINTLHAALRERVVHQPGVATGAVPVASPAAAAGVAPPVSVTLMADKDIPYRLLRKLMVTCAQADLSQVSFAVRQQLKVT